MKISSPAFEQNKMIPKKYTCDGEDLSPPLKFEDIPAGAVSLVLIVDDPDAPVGTFVHWTIWNIAPATTEIPQGSVPGEAQQGMTDFGKVGYGGPCPPFGTHRYFFKLAALDTPLQLPTSSRKSDIEAALGGHILAQAELIGLYSRQR